MMQPPALRRIAAVIFAATVMSTCAFAQPAKQYQPKEYQDGKDVVWVPTAQTLVDRMLDIAGVTASDYVVDLGSGDGRTVITAAKRGAKALGVEYNPKMVELSKANAAKEGVTDKATFVKADLFKTDFSQATVLTMFLLPEINLKLRPKILAMKPGTRVVSNSFDMGDWKADQTIDPVQKCKDYCNAFLLDRAGEGRGHMEGAGRPAGVETDVPVLHRQARQRQGRDAREGRPPQRRRVHLHRRHHHLQGPRGRQRDGRQRHDTGRHHALEGDAR